MAAAAAALATKTHSVTAAINGKMLALDDGTAIKIRKSWRNNLLEEH